MSLTLSKAEMRRLMKMPLRKAYQIAIQSIKVRFWRSMITAVGIVLGIAFFAAARTTSLLSSVDANDPAAQETQARLAWLVVMSLLMCLVGITNSMLMSVTERYKEIGTMKCLGATDSFIVKVFLIESSLMGVIASVTGAVAGFALIALLRLITEGGSRLANANWGAIGGMFAIAIGIGMLLTVLAAIAPAIRAARMPAAAALRVEI